MRSAARGFQPCINVIEAAWQVGRPYKRARWRLSPASVPCLIASAPCVVPSAPQRNDITSGAYARRAQGRHAAVGDIVVLRDHPHNLWISRDQSLHRLLRIFSVPLTRQLSGKLDLGIGLYRVITSSRSNQIRRVSFHACDADDIATAEFAHYGFANFLGNAPLRGELLGNGIHGVIVAGIERGEPRQCAPGVIEIHLVFIGELGNALDRTATGGMQHDAFYAGSKLLLKLVELPFGVQLPIQRVMVIPSALGAW